MNLKNKYRAVFISDVHLGSKDSKTSELSNFLKSIECEKLFLVGDIIDGWKIKENKWRWNKGCSKVIHQIIKKSKDGTEVIYITGNHDEFLRSFIKYDISFFNILIKNQYSYKGIDGKTYLVIHGDLFDGISEVVPFLSILGDKLYDILLSINTHFNWLRRQFGFGYWSLSQFLKHKVKDVVGFIFEFENNLSSYCKKKGYDGVICGHIHNAEIKTIDDIQYANSGDWVESLTALVEHYNGTWEIINYQDEKNISNNR